MRNQLGLALIVVLLASCSSSSTSTRAPVPAPQPTPIAATTPPPDYNNDNNTPTPTVSNRATHYAQPSRQQLTQVQIALQQQGFYHGKIDGKWGRHTSAAIHKFQQIHHLPATGHLNPATVSALQRG